MRAASQVNRPARPLQAWRSLPSSTGSHFRNEPACHPMRPSPRFQFCNFDELHKFVETIEIRAQIFPTRLIHQLTLSIERILCTRYTSTELPLYSVTPNILRVGNQAAWDDKVTKAPHRCANHACWTLGKNGFHICAREPVNAIFEHARYAVVVLRGDHQQGVCIQNLRFQFEYRGRNAFTGFQVRVIEFRARLRLRYSYLVVPLPALNGPGLY